MIFRTHRWHLQRIQRDQVAWDKARHRPIYKWAVTFSNGAFIRFGSSKWLIIAILRARFKGE